MEPMWAYVETYVETFASPCCGGLAAGTTFAAEASPIQQVAGTALAGTTIAAAGAALAPLQQVQPLQLSKYCKHSKYSQCSNISKHSNYCNIANNSKYIPFYKSMFFLLEGSINPLF